MYAIECSFIVLSLYNKTFADLSIFWGDYEKSKFLKGKWFKFWPSKTFPWVLSGPLKTLGRIDLVDLMYRLLDTIISTDKQSIYVIN